MTPDRDSRPAAASHRTTTLLATGLLTWLMMAPMAASADPRFAVSFYQFPTAPYPGYVVVGDLNGDGFPDVIIGAVYATVDGVRNSGVAYVVFGSPGPFPAHMELADPSIAAGFAACVQAGATDVVAFPYMLSPGKHSTSTSRRICSRMPPCCFTPAGSPLTVTGSVTWRARSIRMW